MKTIIYISLLFFSIHCFGQAETKEEFINQVEKVIVKKYPYDLSTIAYAFKFVTDLQKETIEDEFKRILDPSILHELIINVKDTSSYQWDFSLLHHAKAYTTEDSRREGAFPGKRIYQFSIPIFDNKKHYAMISLSYYCGIDCYYGCTYLFHMTNGRWKMIAKTNCWIG